MADEDVENKSPPSVSTTSAVVSNGGSFAATTESFPAEIDFANFDDEPEAGSPFADYNKPSEQDEDFFATFPATSVEDEDPLRSLPGDAARGRDLFATWDEDEDNGERNAVGDSRSRDASPATSRRWLEQDVEDFFGDSVSAGTSNENKGAGMRSASNNERHLFDLEHGDGGGDDGLGIGANNNIDENVDDELFPSTLVRPIGLRGRGNGASRMPDRYSGAEHRGAEDLFDDLFDDGAGNNELMTNFASFGRTDEHEEQKGPGAPTGTSTKAIDASKPPTVAPPQLGSTSASSPKSITKTEGGGTKNRDLSKSFEAELDDGDDGHKEEDDTPEDDTTVFTVDPLDYFSPSELLDKLSSYDPRNYVFRQIQFAVLVPGKLQFGFAMGGRGTAGGIMRRDFIVDAHTWSLSSSVATPLHFRDREMVLRPVETNDVLMLMYGSSPQENTHEIVLLLNGQVAGWWALQVPRSDVEELYGDDFEEDDYGAGLVAPGSGEQSRDHLADMNLTGEDATSELLKLTKLQKLNVRKVDYPLTRLGKVCYGDRTGIIGPDGHSLMEVGTGIFYEGVVDFVRNPKTL
eukprot:g14521.t1